MRHEDYTADAICRAMDLSGFIEEQWTHADIPALRVVLTPSFHPELCITISRSGDAALLSAIALRNQLWVHPEMNGTHDCADIRIPLNAFEDAVALFLAAIADVDPHSRSFCVDGMGSESCLVSQAGVQRLRASVSERPSIGSLVTRLIDLAWTGCHHPRVRNVLAKAAGYMGIGYPLQEVPPETLLAVLGMAEERHEVLEMLRRRKRDRE